MPATESFTSAANGISGTSATFMSTESFTSSAAAVSGASGSFMTNAGQGSALYSRHGFEVRVVPAGVYVTKASALGGTQVALTFPLSKTDAHELALALLLLSN